MTSESNADGQRAPPLNTWETSGGSFTGQEPDVRWRERRHLSCYIILTSCLWGRTTSLLCLELQLVVLIFTPTWGSPGQAKRLYCLGPIKKEL